MRSAGRIWEDTLLLPGHVIELDARYGRAHSPILLGSVNRRRFRNRARSCWSHRPASWAKDTNCRARSIAVYPLSFFPSIFLSLSLSLSLSLLKKIDIGSPADPPWRSHGRTLNSLGEASKKPVQETGSRECTSARQPLLLPFPPSLQPPLRSPPSSPPPGPPLSATAWSRWARRKCRSRFPPLTVFVESQRRGLREQGGATFSSAVEFHVLPDHAIEACLHRIPRQRSPEKEPKRENARAIRVAGLDLRNACCALSGFARSK